MERMIMFKRYAVNRYMLAIMVCSALSLMLVVAIWWYYDAKLHHIQHEIDRQESLYKKSQFIIPIKDIPEEFNALPHSFAIMYKDGNKRTLKSVE